MISRVLLSLLAFSSLIFPVIAQQGQPTASPQQPTVAPARQPTPPEVDAQDVVKITTNLVQIDVSVTKDGKPVTDLQPQDFEVFEDGKPQAITNFSFISNFSPAGASAAPTRTRRDETAPPIAPAKISIENHRRTIALLIDDLGMSFASVADVRRQLRKYLDEQVRPDDLVAIIRTGGDVGALQQFTNDKRMLSNAIDHIRWNPCSRAGLYVFTPVGTPGRDSVNYGPCAMSPRDSVLASLHIFRFVLEAMRYLPGRKSMVIMSDQLPISSGESETLPTDDSENSDTPISLEAAFRKVAEVAIRSAVVIYAVDTRGLQYTGLTAADQVRFPSRTTVQPDQVLSRISMARSMALASGRQGADLVVRQTGGFMVANSNNFGLKQMMEDQAGYYLIGFRPAEETFDRTFHSLKIKLKRGGLTLRTRAGFYGFTDEEARGKQLSAADQITKALISPFGANDITLRLTSFYMDDPSQGPVVRTFLYFDPNDLNFTEAEGWHSMTLEIRSIMFGDNGRVLAQEDRSGRIRLRREAYQRALQNGITYSFDIPVKARGQIHFRVAVRDVVTSHIGAAGQLVEIPELKNGRLALSGVVARAEETAAAASPATDQNLPATNGPAVRRFRQGANVDFAFVIYNAAAAAQAGQLTQQIRLIRDGKIVFTGSPKAIGLDGQADPQRIATGSVVQMGPALTPGDYIFQVIVTDSSDKQKPRVVSQWIDFEVIK